MSEKNQVLMRTCKKCEEQLATTAREIKDHAEKCSGKDDANIIVVAK